MTPKEFAKKIIASINPGTADISGIGDGTIKGAISEQNKKCVITDSHMKKVSIFRNLNLNFADGIATYDISDVYTGNESVGIAIFPYKNLSPAKVICENGIMHVKHHESFNGTTYTSIILFHQK